MEFTIEMDVSHAVAAARISQPIDEKNKSSLLTAVPIGYVVEQRKLRVGMLEVYARDISRLSV